MEASNILRESCELRFQNQLWADTVVFKQLWEIQRVGENFLLAFSM